MYIEYNGTQQNVLEYIPDTLIKTEKLTIKGKDVKSFVVRGIEMNIKQEDKQEDFEQIIKGYKGKGYDNFEKKTIELVFNAYVKKGKGYEYIINLDSFIDEKEIKSLNRKASIKSYLERKLKYIKDRINIDMITEAIIEIKAIKLSKESINNIIIPPIKMDEFCKIYVVNGIASNGVYLWSTEAKDGWYTYNIPDKGWIKYQDVSSEAAEVISGISDIFKKSGMWYDIEIDKKDVATYHKSGIFHISNSKAKLLNDKNIDMGTDNFQISDTTIKKGFYVIKSDYKIEGRPVVFIKYSVKKDIDVYYYAGCTERQDKEIEAWYERYNK